eukprot:1298680-Karenia_brevis.AAC.1
MFWELGELFGNLASRVVIWRAHQTHAGPSEADPRLLKNTSRLPKAAVSSSTRPHAQRPRASLGKPK